MSTSGESNLFVWYLHLEELGLRKAVVHSKATCEELQATIAANGDLLKLERYDAELLEKVEECIPLVVCLENRYSIQEHGDTFLVQGFRQSVKKVLIEQPPLHIPVKSSTYEGSQSILNTHHSELNLLTPSLNTSTSIELFHPVFARFSRDMDDESIYVPPKTVDTTFTFMRSASNHICRMERLLAVLDLSRDVLVSDEAVHRALLPVTVYLKLRRSAPTVILLESEEVNLPGNGNLDAEASYVYKNLWAQPERRRLLESSSSPSFIVTFADSRICIFGAVWTTKPIIQCLADIVWSGTTPNEYDGKAGSLRVARIFLTLKECIKALECYYQELDPIPSDSSLLNDTHERFYPFITSYPDPCSSRVGGGAKSIEFEYIEPLEKDALDRCVTYRGRIRRARSGNTCQSEGCEEGSRLGRSVVVKFVRGTYGEAAHRLLAAHSMAPDLLYRGPVFPYSKEEGQDEGWSMVVMSYIQGRTISSVFGCMEVSEEVYRSVKEILNVLHGSGYVHGDLRRQNIMIEMPVGREREGEGQEQGSFKTPESGRIVLFDFDWAGKAGTARYPMSRLNRRTAYPLEVAEGKKIKLEHDEWMLEELKRPVECHLMSTRFFSDLLRGSWDLFYVWYWILVTYPCGLTLREKNFIFRQSEYCPELDGTGVPLEKARRKTSHLPITLDLQLYGESVF
ncbi:hypothetical protein K435DRAFT_798248 [Dendrothele bispora CBS 962.96]|uniref:Uncharacterized protein n=1 Tax=Dendrothele bispora (strain CBS 962.96) TaxID=1314807 RepID=A0A4S8M0J2_DENBC|nr:hypothetical protein K435DRAFT_798248 [Dendrothele bispora CBS 962.96]